MWKQELLWVKRDERGQIIGVSEKPPANEDFIPSVPVARKGERRDQTS